MAASGVKISRIGPFEYNPRGNIWFKNENSFGRQLLSKMGWSQGKGLGKNEDGIKENIKVLKKDNTAGVGYKKDVNIAVGCLEYEKILSKLQHQFNKDGTKWDVDSLEQRSRNSASRLHYQKFVRGKDLYRYSEKDMKCIFLDNPQEEVSNDESEKNEDTTFKSQMNMKDYFALKMKQKFGSSQKLNSGKVSVKVKNEEQLTLPYPVSNKKRKTEEKSQKVKRIKLDCSEKLSEDLSDQDEKDRKVNKLGISFSVKKISKKMKSKKKKLHKIKDLKSCLKSKSSYNLGITKNVSFSDEVHFKIFDSVVDENDTCCEDLAVEISATCESDFDESENNQDVNVPDSIGDSTTCVENFEVIEEGDAIEINSTDPHSDYFHLSGDELERIDSHADETSEESAENSIPETSTLEEYQPLCLEIPKNSSSFNAWRESQRQALKMKLYKDMIKNLQKHDILSSSNLLDIKGYGNWGF